MSFKLTKQQKQIVELANSGEHVAITAGAGTGKTSTLQLIAESKKDLNGLYVAFSKAVQVDAEARFPRSTQCSTAHSLAWRAGGNQYKSRLDAPRLSTSAIVEFLDADPITVWFEDKRDGSQTYGEGFVAGLAMRMVDKFCQSADLEISEKHMPRIPGLDSPGEWKHHQQIAPKIVELARRAWWRDLVNFKGQLRFTHDMYLKLFQVKNAQAEGDDAWMRFDFLFADEAQDLSPVMVDIFQRQARLGTQVIAVGDSQQAIYGWRGAVDAMDMIDGAVSAELSLCWRFGEEIAVPVNRMLDILGTDMRLKGMGGPGEVGEFPGARVVLARSNSRIVYEAMNALGQRRKFAIVGNLPKQIKSFAQGARALMDTGSTFHPELSWASSWSEVLRYVEDDMLGDDLGLMVTLVDDYGTERIIDAMNSAVEEGAADLVLSTMHASKGREWPEVRLCGDYKRDEEGKPNLSVEDRRLFYVAASRAKTGLDLSECMDIYYPSHVAAT